MNENKINEKEIKDELKDTKKATLGDYVTFYNGLKGMNSTNFSCENSNAKYIQFKNIHESKILKDNLGDVYVEELDKQNNVLKGDLLLTGSSENIEEVGTTNINTLSMDNLFVNSFSYIMRPVDINPLYLHYLLKSPNSRKQIMLAGQGITRINLSPSRISNMKISVHDKNTQNNIATLLSSIDDLIAHNEERLQTRELMKQSYMKQVFDNDHTNVISKNKWSVHKLEDFMTLTTGKLDANAMVENGQYPFFTCSKEPYKIDTFAFDCEAILISGNGSQLGHINYYNGKFNAYQRTYVLKDFKINSFYMKYYLESHLNKQINKEVSASNVPYIKSDTLNKMVFYVPTNMNYVNQIANLLSTMDEDINLINERVNNLKVMKQHYLNIIFK